MIELNEKQLAEVSGGGYDICQCDGKLLGGLGKPHGSMCIAACCGPKHNGMVYTILHDNRNSRSSISGLCKDHRQDADDLARRLANGGLFGFGQSTPVYGPKLSMAPIHWSS